MSNIVLNTQLNDSIENISNNNTSFTTLNSGETYTGTGELNGFSNVLVFVKTDKEGELYVDLGVKDGGAIYWDTQLMYTIRPSDIAVPHNLLKGSRYYRVRFVNTSGEDQNEFRLISVFGNSFNQTTTALNTVLSQSFDAIATRPNDYFTDVAESKREGAISFRKFGYNDGVSTTIETISSVSDPTENYVPLTTASTIEITTNSANDISGGTGAWELLLTGVDGDGLLTQETFTITGGTITSTSLWLAVDRVKVTKAGSLKYNDAVIEIRDTNTGSLQAYITATDGITEQLHFRVPDISVALIYRIYFNVVRLSGTSPLVRIDGFQEKDGVRTRFFRKKASVQSRGSVELESTYIEAPIVIEGGGSWYFEAQVENSGSVSITGYILQVVKDEIGNGVTVI